MLLDARADLNQLTTKGARLSAVGGQKDASHWFSLRGHGQKFKCDIFWLYPCDLIFIGDVATYCNIKRKCIWPIRGFRPMVTTPWWWPFFLWTTTWMSSSMFQPVGPGGINRMFSQVAYDSLWLVGKCWKEMRCSSENDRCKWRMFTCQVWQTTAMRLDLSCFVYWFCLAWG